MRVSNPGRRVAPTGSRGHTYSPRRLRLVLALLTVLTLPLVIGSSILIYYYLRYSVMVERRLHGERWLVPARIYARPVVLRTGLPLAADEVVKILNGLRYEQKEDIPHAPGEFVVGARMVVFNPRPVADAPGEPVAVSFEKRA